MALSRYENDDFFEGVMQRFFDAPRSLWPMDVSEHEDRYEITADCPGYGPEDITLEHRDRYLTICGERKATKEQKSPKTAKGKSFLRERVYGSFSRSFTLPEDADTSKIRASLDKGVLTVDVPKTEPKKLPKPRRITVNASSASSGH